MGPAAPDTPLSKGAVPATGTTSGHESVRFSLGISQEPRRVFPFNVRVGQSRSMFTPFGKARVLRMRLPEALLFVNAPLTFATRFSCFVVPLMLPPHET